MFRRLLIAVLICCFGVVAAPRTGAQSTAGGTNGQPWWKHAVFYEIYPRSFADSNNNGIGDLNGIASKLDYLKWLGVNAIWITPCFPSPQVDFGYDVSNYEDIDPMYGTLADFDHLMAEAKKRNIRIILDFVVNHTSDKHPWFLDSRSSRTSAHRDWYIWRDGKGPGQPPNNWESTFGGSAWQWDPKTKQYYYHFFYAQQPDLNWRNPAVEKAMFNVTRFWYKRGVAGFRLDAVSTLFEDPNLHDNPILPGKNAFGGPKMEDKYNTNLPEVHTELQRLRKVADEYGAVLIGETWTDNVTELRKYYGPDNNELQMPMDLMLTSLPFSAEVYRKHVGAVEGSGEWPVFVISNHDIVRSYTRYGDGKHNDDIAKLMASFYLTLRGTPIMYYGEEIGMRNNDPKRREDVKDPIGRRGWPKVKGRDGERTPMQWTPGKNAGFSVVKPWLPVPPSAATYNVETEEKNPHSILNYYHRVLTLRHTDKALLHGDYVALNEDDPNVLSYLRQYKDEAVLVVLNMSNAPQEALFDLSKQGFANAKMETLLANKANASAKGAERISLEPYGAYIAKLEK
jgi:alpha-glucosidase